MLITLIDPYIITKKYNSTMSTSLPLGIAYLASSLKKAKINVQIIDCIGEGINQFEFYKNDLVKWGLNEKQIIARINKYSKIIGISINHSCQHNIVIKIIKIIKRIGG